MSATTTSGSTANQNGVSFDAAAAQLDVSNGPAGLTASTSNGISNGGGSVKLENNGSASTGYIKNGKAPALGTALTHSLSAVAADLAASAASAKSEDEDDDESFRPIFDGSMIDKKEFVRLTLQSLRDLGFGATALELEKESGVKLEHPSITAFRKAVLSGEWKNADRLLMEGLRHAAARRLRNSATSSSGPAHAGSSSLAVPPSGGASGSSSGAGTSTPASGAGGGTASSSSVNINCVLRDPESQSLEYIKFALQQQRFLELLEAGHNKKALSVLRDRLTPLNYGSERLHQLSSLMVCESPEQLRARARWDGANGSSRRDLLHEIESAVLPSVMIPSRRLPQLLEQAQDLQKQMDPYYNSDSKTEHLSLYVDVQSDRSGFPSVPTFKLYDHSDEVWALDFSPDGTKLASGGRNRELITYSVSPTVVEKTYVYAGFSAGISCVRWSPDSRKILCAVDEVVYLIDTAVSVYLQHVMTEAVATWKKALTLENTQRSFHEHVYRITAVSWLPDGSGFVTGSMDSKVLFWNSTGQVTRRWDISPYRVLGLDVSPDGKKMVVISYRVEPPNQQHSSASSVSYSDSPSPSSTTVGHHEDGGGASSGRAGLSALMRSGGQERNRIWFYDLGSFSVTGMAGATEEMIYASISKDSRHVLINKRPNEIQLWDLESQEPVQIYRGHTIFKNFIGACFGGAEKNNFIISGSEDAKIYIYHRVTGRTLERLNHGSGCVNSVAWHPTNKAMFASASDDSSVIVWAPGERPRRRTAAATASSSSINGKGGSGDRRLSSSSRGNGFRRVSSGSALLDGDGAHGRPDSRRKSEGASGSRDARGAFASGEGASGNGIGNGRGGGEGGNGSGSESGLMGGPIPFPWAVSPLHRDSEGDDDGEDVSMMDEGMYEDPL
ncbi:hypothetical protein OC846_000245 [Tilletia horrida]|uniref:CTLH domain-containing protein n=1 Tax=Tilletia horrida TaxID=155126 RepID=A0AAN6K101_9BASI|nr:hypothetical protein OC846_000245 [Tilletia horrida]